MVFGVKMKMVAGREVSVKSLRIVKILTEEFGSFGSREWKIPRSIKESNENTKLEWLKAFFEDEAYNEKKYDRLKTKSMNPSGLMDVKHMLDSLKIFSSLTGPNCDDSYYLTIPKFSSIEEFRGFIKEPIRK